MSQTSSERFLFGGVPVQLEKKGSDWVASLPHAPSVFGKGVTKQAALGALMMCGQLYTIANPLMEALDVSLTHQMTLENLYKLFPPGTPVRVMQDITAGMLGPTPPDQMNRIVLYMGVSGVVYQYSTDPTYPLLISFDSDTYTALKPDWITSV